MKYLLVVALLFVTSSCGNAAYEIIKPKKSDPLPNPPEPTPTPNLPVPPLPIPTTEPKPIPTPTQEPPVNPPNPIPTPSSPTLPPAPIPGNPNLPPVVVPNPPGNIPFPPQMPRCPGAPCQVRDTEIILVVDSSSSMSDKKTMIQKNINILINFFRPFLNVRITIVGGNNNCSEPFTLFNFNYGVRRYDNCVGSSNAISRLNQTLATLPFSPTANIEAVIISDGNGRGAGNMAMDFAIQARPTKISSVVGVEKPSGLFCIGWVVQCSYERIGWEHMILSQQTGAGIYDICNANWSPLLISIYNRLL